MRQSEKSNRVGDFINSRRMGIHLGEEVEGALGNTLMGESSSAAPLIRPGLDPGL